MGLFHFVILYLCSVQFVLLKWTHTTLKIGPTSPTPLQKKRRVVTESPTTSVVMGSSDLQTPGNGRRFWTAKDPGHRLGNIAGPRQSWRQRKPRGSGMRRQHGSAVGSLRGSLKNVLEGVHTGSVAK
jgi:hypothetical protein